MNRTKRQIPSGYFDRTIALLLSLAEQTERIARLPLPIRFLFLWLLRAGEKQLRAMLADRFAEFGVAAPLLRAGEHLPLDCYSRTEAMHLACAFRRIARLIEHYAQQTGATVSAAAARAPELTMGADNYLSPPDSLDWLRMPSALPNGQILRASSRSRLSRVLRRCACFVGLAADHPPPI